MFELLDQLRSKSERYRRTLAIIIVSIITGIIFLIWAVGALTRLSKVNLEIESEVSTSTNIKSAFTFSSFKEKLETVLEEGAGMIDSIRGPVEYTISEPETE